MAIKCGTEECSHSILGKDPGVVCRKVGGSMIWAKAMEQMMGSGEWPIWIPFFGAVATASRDGKALEPIVVAKLVLKLISG